MLENITQAGKIFSDLRETQLAFYEQIQAVSIITYRPLAQITGFLPNLALFTIQNLKNYYILDINPVATSDLKQSIYYFLNIE